MPTTVNGIGTHYYGKKNRSMRTAVCGACHRVGALESYDTRLWFVIFFIPVIPLGRKRIIDKCPYCTRHMAAAADAYEQARQLQTSGSLERYRREPSPEAALEAHAHLLAFHEHEQAAQFRAAVLERFRDHAALRAGLAAQLHQVASFDASAELYEAALGLEPDLPEARVGVALRKMARGELDEARRLLDFLEAPGAGRHYALGPLDVLSGYYQRQGRHEDALALVEHLLRELPQAGQQHAFRAFVRKSEKALGRPGTILPPREHSLRGLFRARGSPYPAWLRWLAAIGAGLALLAAGLLINNESIRRNRTIHVVNACDQPVQVRADDGPPVSVAGLGHLVVSEGRHRLWVSGPVDQALDVDVRAGFFDRWSHKPLWVLNPGGEAVLDEATVYYAEHPQPSEHRVIVGQPWLARTHVDYPFEPPPNHLQVERGSGPVVKTAVRWVQGRDVDAFLAALPGDRAAALDFAERRLRRKPDQDELLKAYLESTVLADGRRAEAFLESGLRRRPVAIAWHRAYQSLAEHNRHDRELVARYDGYLAAEPTSGALLYLRGRVEPDWDRQAEFYRRAIAADPRLPWPWLARGVRAAAAARWDESLRCLRRARELKLGEAQVGEALHVARLATGDAEALVRDYRARLAANAVDPDAMVLLCEALAAAGQAERIEPEVANWIDHLPASLRLQLADPVRAYGLYVAGKLAECERLCRGFGPLRPSSLRAQALLALGRAEEAAADGLFVKVWEDPWSALAVSLGLSLAGRSEEAARWRERACGRLEALTTETREVAKALGAAAPVPVEDLDRVIVDPEDKALTLAVLGERFPARRAEYRAAAGRFHVRRKPPYHLVQRAIGGPAAGAP